MSKQITAIPYKKLGGVRTDKALTDMQEGDAVVAKNCRFNRFSKVSSRKGITKYNNTQIGTGDPLLGGFFFKYGTGSSKNIEATDTDVYTDDGTTRSSIKGSLNSSDFYWFEPFDSELYICNSADKMLTYDGTTVRQASIDAPVVGTFAAADSGVAGNVNGTVKYLVTFYNSTLNKESNPFALSSAVTISVVNKKVDLTNIPVSTDPQVNARRIYRTVNGGSEYNAKYLATIADNITTTYQDNIADASLGELINLFYDTAPVFKKVVLHRGRLFGITGTNSTVYYSYDGIGWYWPQGLVDLSETGLDYTIPIREGDGDLVRNIIVYQDILFIQKDTSLWILEGYDETDFTLREVKNDDRAGTLSFRGSAVAGNYLYFVGNNIIYRTNGSQVDKIFSKPIEGFFDPNNTNTSDKIDLSKIKESIAIVDDTKPYNVIHFTFTSVAGTPIHLIYDYLLDQWSVDTGFKANCMWLRRVSNQDYLTIGDDYGFVWTMNSVNGDGGQVSSVVTGSGNTTLTDATQSWTTDIYEGAYVEITSGVGIGQRRKIVSNTATQLTVTPAWSTNPSVSDTYVIGAIDYVYQPFWDNYGEGGISNRLKFLRLRLDTDGNDDIPVYFLYDFQVDKTAAKFISVSSGSLWDTALWDESTWDGASMVQDMVRPTSHHIHEYSSFSVEKKITGQAININAYEKFVQPKGLIIR